jgi:hypothetical protein
MGNVASNEYWGHQIPREHDYGKDRRLTIRSVKMFTDGQCYLRTAYHSY